MLSFTKNTVYNILAIITMSVFAFWYFGYIPGNPDVNLFLNIARNINNLREGVIDSFGVGNGYPPLISSIFFWINKIPVFSFYTNWVIIVVGVLSLTVLFTGKYYNDEKSYQFIFALIFCATLINPEFLFGRFDYIIIALLYLSIKAHQANYSMHAALFLTIGIFIKIIPIVVLPILIIKSITKGSLKECLWGIAAGIIIAVAIPVFTMGYQSAWNNTFFLLFAHAQRGIQAESTWSALHMAISNMQGIEDKISLHASSFHNTSVWAIAPMLSLYLGIGGIILVSAFSFYTRNTYQMLVITVLLWCLFIAPVFSPQYIIWVLPLVIVELLQRINDVERVAIETLFFLIIIVIIGYLTQNVYLSGFLHQKTIWPILLLNIRNFSILVCMFLVMGRSAGTDDTSIR